MTVLNELRRDHAMGRSWRRCFVAFHQVEEPPAEDDSAVSRGMRPQHKLLFDSEIEFNGRVDSRRVFLRIRRDRAKWTFAKYRRRLSAVTRAQLIADHIVGANHLGM
jgi:hypothetical protein